MKLHKIITLSASILMLASVGAGVSNMAPSSVHASQTSRLIRQRNNARNKYNYYMKSARSYKNLINKLNRELTRINLRKPNKHKRIHYSNRKAYFMGYTDGKKSGLAYNYYMNHGAKDSDWKFFLNQGLKNNKQYRKGWINGGTYGYSKQEPRKDAYEAAVENVENFSYDK